MLPYSPEQLTTVTHWKHKRCQPNSSNAVKDQMSSQDHKASDAQRQCIRSTLARAEEAWIGHKRMKRA